MLLGVFFLEGGGIRRKEDVFLKYILLYKISNVVCRERGYALYIYTVVYTVEEKSLVHIHRHTRTHIDSTYISFLYISLHNSSKPEG